jgi:2-keto-4-pentenoate hydratase/2-oxohepta-3-ene-1,7-dioic acid hydratase in catechol pathway
MQYVYGHTVDNDVSSRYWQSPERSVNQQGSPKSFVKFTPIRPIILSPELTPDPHNLSIKSFVNGLVRQSARTDGPICSVPNIIRHISRGTTIRRGTVVMIETPSGVATFMDPLAGFKTAMWLKPRLRQSDACAVGSLLRNESMQHNEVRNNRLVLPQYAIQTIECSTVRPAIKAHFI